MKYLAHILFLTLALDANGISYWFSQWQNKPDAQQAAAFFIWPGSNIVFTVASNHVIINGAPGGGTNLVVVTNNYYITNGIFITNSSGGTNYITITNNYYITNSITINNGGGTASNLPNFTATWPLTVSTSATTIEYGMQTNAFATTNLVGVTSNALYWLMPTTNGFVDSSVTNGLLGAGSVGSAAYSNAADFYLSSNPSNYATWTATTQAIASAGQTLGSIGITVDGAGAVVTNGVKGYVSLPYAAIITGARMLADQGGTVVMDVWRTNWAGYPPTAVGSLSAGAGITLSATDHFEDTTLTGWTTNLAAGDVLGFNVSSASTVTRITLQLTLRRQ